MYILSEHKLKYLNRRIIDIEELKNSLSQNDFDLPKIIGHRLKGNGVTFGYPLISEIGIALEMGAIAKDKLKILESIDLLIQVVDEGLKLLH